MQDIIEKIRKEIPFKLLGTSFCGAGITDSIKAAKRYAEC
jgi:hypothetical protein